MGILRHFLRLFVLSFLMASLIGIGLVIWTFALIVRVLS